MKERLFYSADAAGATIGVTGHHFIRLAREAGVQRDGYGKTGRVIFTKDQVDKVRTYWELHNTRGPKSIRRKARV